MEQNKGIYILFLIITKDLEIRIGSLGEVKLNKGLYLYVGSAQKNLQKRIERHLKKEKKTFWHIDYLTKNESVEIISVALIQNATKETESNIACKLMKRFPFVKNFGASDDKKCNTHLFRIL
ncbi:GIY-YIG nuclease family protein [Thermosipho atlanticus]|uniref:Uri superfamily endonuclease n=1 Tax=Thermosipho atlanticus DSM 15807 TaxID=1123380 RepID=A0A1M5U1V4_9BACT|nr:GIY-YIG nuclease family protein [Thermosipho atlanticus]SHH56623.1 Uri superfamily endonuclease [Thermosipho atlanticus DSM 15807]